MAWSPCLPVMSTRSSAISSETRPHGNGSTAILKPRQGNSLGCMQCELGPKSRTSKNNCFTMIPDLVLVIMSVDLCISPCSLSGAS